MSLNENFGEQLDTLKSLRDAVEEAESKLYKYFDENFEEIIKEYHSRLNQPALIRWAQYTPSFNDGDPCLFGVYCQVKERDRPYTDSETASRIKNFIQSNSDALEYKYGDGFEITVDEKGIDVSEYQDW